MDKGAIGKGHKAAASKASMTADGAAVSAGVHLLRIDDKPATKKFLAQVTYKLALDDDGKIVGTPICRVPTATFEDELVEGAERDDTLTVIAQHEMSGPGWRRCERCGRRTLRIAPIREGVRILLVCFTCADDDAKMKSGAESARASQPQAARSLSSEASTLDERAIPF
jgi:hypothetical protein